MVAALCINAVRPQVANLHFANLFIITTTAALVYSSSSSSRRGQLLLRHSARY